MVVQCWEIRLAVAGTRNLSDMTKTVSKMVNVLFLDFMDYQSCLVWVKDEIKRRYTYLRHKATIEEGAPGNDVEERACQAALGRHVFSIIIKDVTRLPK